MSEGQLQGEARFRRRAVNVDEAIGLVIETAVPGRQERVPLWQAAGRRLAEAVIATADWPPFARSGMDGFAVRSTDTALATPGEPARLRVVDAVAAGGLAAANVEPGTAVRIMTGGAVPAGADAVVMLEQTADARVDGLTAVLVKRAAEPGQNIAPRGEEFRRGSVFAEPGELLRPGHVALLGTFGYADVPVYARPRVAVLATGEELLPVEAPLAPGRIRDSNSAMIAALVAQYGGEPVLLGRVPDEPVAAAQAITEALMRCDLVITTGGVSVGDYDVMAHLLQRIRTEPGAQVQMTNGEALLTLATGALRASVNEALRTPASNALRTPPADSMQTDSIQRGYDGGQQIGRLPLHSRLLFNKTAMRPGSPTSAAVVNGKLLLALSGNPGACFVGFELFARPALAMLQGATAEAARPKQVTAQLAGGFAKGSPHERFVRSRLYVENGVLHAEPLAHGKSSMMASLPAADGLVRMKAGSVGPEAGSLVSVIVTSDFGR